MVTNDGYREFRLYGIGVIDGSGRVVGISLELLLAMWLADVLGNITDKVDWLKNISLFHYWQPVEVIDNSVSPVKAGWYLVLPLYYSLQWPCGRFNVAMWFSLRGDDTAYVVLYWHNHSKNLPCLFLLNKFVVSHTENIPLGSGYLASITKQL